jgi:hypothetical protein
VDNIKSLFNSSLREDFRTQQTLTLIGLASLVTLLIALVPWLSGLVYPFRLLTTLVHELSHGLAALLTGGAFIRFVVSPNGAGLAYTAGGWRWVIIPAGYVGAALFGAVLVLLGRSHRWSRLALGIIGATMALLSLRYGAPSIISGDFLNGILTTVSGVIFGGFFLWVALKASPGWIIFLLYLVAIQAGLTAFSDLTSVMGLSLRFFTAPANDAQSMAELTYIPAIIWAVLWALLAVILIGGAVWITWFRVGKD